LDIKNALFCDVFEMENTKVKRLTSYLAEVKEQAAGSVKDGL
jgi:hypothetical protein